MVKRDLLTCDEQGSRLGSWKGRAAREKEAHARTHTHTTEQRRGGGRDSGNEADEVRRGRVKKKENNWA